MFPKIKQTRMLLPSPEERRHSRVAVFFLFFLAVFGMGSMGQSVVTVTCFLLNLLLPIPAEVRLLADLFGTGFLILAVILWSRLFERRSFAGLGFVRRGAVAEYLVGLVAGVLLFSGAVGLCVLVGIAKVDVAAFPPSWWFLFLFFVGFLIQGMSEELLCRSFLMIGLSRKWPLWACILTNAGIFSALHFLNPGVTPLALLNIFLFGVLASLLTLRRGSIWMVAALHSLWNFAQGNLFGIPVSGLTGAPAPLTTVITGDTRWQRLLGGGDFGMEGGLAATAVLIVGILVIMLIPTKKSELV